MKKLLIVILLASCGGILIAQNPPPVTPGIGLYIPDHGSLNWDTWYNLNWNLLDAFGVLQMKTKPAAHIETTGSTNNDVSMILSIAQGGASVSHTFVAAYNFQPSCVASPNLIALGLYQMQITKSNVTVVFQNAAPAGGALVYIHCFGAPN